MSTHIREVPRKTLCSMGSGDRLCSCSTIDSFHVCLMTPVGLFLPKHVRGVPRKTQCNMDIGPWLPLMLFLTDRVLYDMSMTSTNLLMQAHVREVPRKTLVQNEPGWQLTRSLMVFSSSKPGTSNTQWRLDSAPPLLAESHKKPLCPFYGMSLCAPA
ncbi:hypothetical protein HGRIS_004517 [Hohenbuehelia grisea]|uniref:Uncharacterized protein n=1 Tax=Hohenbuehelia grisea TaxID=104357 RepID=A0ABR3JCR7_9AGAR